MYRIHLQDFEGPLDLLLFFIRRDELDVFDIPIASIADEYLAYVRVMEQVDLDAVGDFLYMAALLVHIKARMLLPSEEVDEEGEPVDPRRELVERLLEYIRYKEASEEISQRYEQRQDQFTRGHASTSDAYEHAEEDVPVDATVFDLIRALRRVLTEAPVQATHAVQREDYSVPEQQAYILRRLRSGTRTGFRELVAERSRAFVIATFLAVLELARLGEVVLLLSDDAEAFFLEPGPGRAVGPDERSPAPPINGHANPQMN